MYRCMIPGCGREFKTSTALVSHLTHSKSLCKTNIKEYYDKYLRKPGEGICRFCKTETSFVGITLGYPFNLCKYCKTKDPETIKKQKESRDKIYKQRKIDSGYFDLPEICEICKEQGLEKRFKTKAGLARHVNNLHKIKPKDYYDKYLKTNDEGICQVTGEPTTFINLTLGYHKFLGRGINSRDLEIQKKKENTLLNNYGVINPVNANSEKRINSFKQTYDERRVLQNKRLELISIIRKLSIDQTDKNQCQICGVRFGSLRSLSVHIMKSHNILIKDYYDMYWKEKGEGICLISGKNTTFVCLETGYLKWANGYQQQDPEIIKKQHNTFRSTLIRRIIKEQHKFDVMIYVDQVNKVTDYVDIFCIKCNNKYKNSWYNIRLGYGKCPRCYPAKNWTSKGEEEVQNFIKDLFPKETVLVNYRGLIRNPNTKKTWELDVFIPSKNIAIEYDGLFWHSELNQIDPNYHLLKTQECKNNGVELIHIFEDEWILKKNIVKSIIKHKLGVNNTSKIYARKCKIKEVKSNIKNNFLDQNHIQGKDSSTIKLGAFYKDELVAIMTFSHGNPSKGGLPHLKMLWELNRFATNQNYRVIGIAGKLLKYFQRNFKWTQIYSYVDLRYSNGNLYKKIGFELLHQTKPTYWYIIDKNIKRVHRYNLRKTPDEPKEIPEWKLRLEQGYYRIWDCGHLKFVMQNQ